MKAHQGLRYKVITKLNIVSSSKEAKNADIRITLQPNEGNRNSASVKRSKAVMQENQKRKILFFHIISLVMRNCKKPCTKHVARDYSKRMHFEANSLKTLI